MRTRKILSSVLLLLCSVGVSAAGTAAAASAAAAVASDSARAESPWKLTGSLGLNASASGFYRWKGGGSNSATALVYTRLRLLYHRNRLAWDTDVNLQYGLNWKDEGTDKLRKSSDKINVATKLGWEFTPEWYLSVLGAWDTQFAYGRTYSGDALPDPVTSMFMAPGYFDLSAGIDWKPRDWFSAYISPLAGRITVVSCTDRTNRRCYQQLVDETVSAMDLFLKKNPDCGYDGAPDDADAFRNFISLYYSYYLSDYTIEDELKNSYGLWHYEEESDGILIQNFDRHSRAEFGLALKCAANYSYKGFTAATTISLFTPYKWDKRRVYTGGPDSYLHGLLLMEPDEQTIQEHDMQLVGYLDNNRRFGHFDVDWSLQLGYQFLKVLQVTLSGDLRYYPGVRMQNVGTSTEQEKIQLKGIIGLGIGYAF